jgi:hypothetical protein
LDVKKLLDDSKMPDYPKYITNLLLNETKVHEDLETTEEEIFNKQPQDINPLIYFRLERPLRGGAELPELNLEEFFHKTEFHGFDIELTPDYSFEINEELIENDRTQSEEIMYKLSKFNKKFDNDIIEAIDNYLQSKEIDFVSAPDIKIDFKDLEFNNRKIKKISKTDLQLRIDAILMYNYHFVNLIPFVIDEERDETSNALFKVGKSLALKSVKHSYINKVITNLPNSTISPNIYINPRKIKKLKQDPENIDHFGEWATFGTIFKACKVHDYENLKISNLSNYPWNIILTTKKPNKGENLFKTSLNYLINELYEPCCPLFVPTQNTK